MTNSTKISKVKTVLKLKMLVVKVEDIQSAVFRIARAKTE